MVWIPNPDNECYDASCVANDKCMFPKNCQAGVKPDGPTIEQFILARIDADKLRIMCQIMTSMSAHEVRKLEGMRKIVEWVSRFGITNPTSPILKIMASMWIDHPDWNEEWRFDG